MILATDCTEVLNIRRARSGGILPIDEEVGRPETALPDKTATDPIRLYLREMASVRLLKREQEVAIAKRMDGVARWCSRPFRVLHWLSKRSSRWAGNCAMGRAQFEKLSTSKRKS